MPDLPYTPAPPKPAFARRGWGLDRYTGARIETTFVSTDRADINSVGWFHGYVEDGAVWEGYVLTHVGEPSWRCVEPVSSVQVERAA